MTLDIAMGGSTNTVLHLLAAAREGEVNFTMEDIDRLSRQVPHLCKVAPSTPQYHMEDVHRAGGVVGILGELARAGLLHTDVTNVLGGTLADTLAQYDITVTDSEEVKAFFRAGPAGIRTTEAFSQNCRWDTLDDDRQNGCIRSKENAYSQDGGLAVLSGNLAVDGCIVKTAGVDAENLTFRGPAIVFESQEDAVDGILGGTVKAGDVVIIRYEGPKGGPGMQEMLYPTTYLKSMGLAKPAPLSLTAASPAVPAVSLSVTFPRKQPMGVPSVWSRPAISLISIFRLAVLHWKSVKTNSAVAVQILMPGVGNRLTVNARSHLP